MATLSLERKVIWQQAKIIDFCNWRVWPLHTDVSIVCLEEILLSFFSRHDSGISILFAIDDKSTAGKTFSYLYPSTHTRTDAVIQQLNEATSCFSPDNNWHVVLETITGIPRTLALVLAVERMLTCPWWQIIPRTSRKRSCWQILQIFTTDITSIVIYLKLDCLHTFF